MANIKGLLKYYIHVEGYPDIANPQRGHQDSATP